MERINSFDEATLRGYVGRPVYAVLNDGSYFCGYLSECRDGCVMLTSAAKGIGTVSTLASRAKSQLESRSKAKTSAWGFPGSCSCSCGGFGAGWSVALPLFLLALLFAFPFGFFW